MADVTTPLSSWSETAASNEPGNADAVGPNTLADNLRTIQSVMREAVAGAVDTIASAATTDLSTTASNYVSVTGTTTITAFGTVSAGIIKVIHFAGALTLTHNATSLILPTGANITTVANDHLLIRSEGSGNWRCLAYWRNSGAALASLPLAGGTMTGDITMSGASIIEAEGAAVASASSTNIWATDGNTVHVTGTTTINDFATAPQAGAWMKVIFDGALQLTHSANLNLNAGGSNITTAAGDFAMVYADTTTQMDVFVIRASGAALAGGGLSAASQAQMEAATDNTVAATPGRTQYHPGVAKCWIKCDAAGTINASYNVTSITDDGTGLVTVTIATDFSSADYVINASVMAGSGSPRGVQVTTQAAGSFQIFCFLRSDGSAVDPTAFFAVCFGDQA